MPGSPETALDRRREILREAVQLIRQGGLAHVTMRRVAAEVGFSETAAYRYFPTKQALLLGLADWLGESLLEPIRRIAAGEGSAEDRLRAILDHHVRFVLQLDGVPMLVMAEAAATGEKELLARMTGIVGAYRALLTEVLTELRPEPGSVRPQELVLLLMGIPAALAIRRRLAPDEDIAARVLEELVPFVVRCVAGKGEEGRARSD